MLNDLLNEVLILVNTQTRVSSFFLNKLVEVK